MGSSLSTRRVTPLVVLPLYPLDLIRLVTQLVGHALGFTRRVTALVKVRVE